MNLPEERLPTPDTAPAEQAPDEAHHRTIRSYVLRAGRMGTGQQRALEELGPRYVLASQGTPADWDTVFGRQAPRVIEIGFGMEIGRAHV